MKDEITLSDLFGGDVFDCDQRDIKSKIFIGIDSKKRTWRIIKESGKREKYTTLTISREQAENMVKRVRELNDKSVESLSDEELDKELHKYIYSEKYTDIVGFLFDYNIVRNTDDLP